MFAFDHWNHSIIFAAVTLSALALGTCLGSWLGWRNTKATMSESWLFEPIKADNLAQALGLVIARYLQFPEVDIDSTIEWVFDAHFWRETSMLGMNASAVPGFRQRVIESGQMGNWRETAHLFLKLKLQALIDCGLGHHPTPVRSH